MILNLIISTLFYTCMLWFGHLMMFIDPFIYYSVPCYFILLLATMKVYNANCKALEGKDFLFCAVFVGIVALAFLYMNKKIDIDVISFTYLACFIPFVGYASSIRYKSLM